MKKLSGYFYLLPAIIVALVIVTSCKKSSSNSSAITKENLAGIYTLTSLTATIAPFPPQSIIDSLPACQRDDQYKLNVDLSFNYIDAGTKCNPAGDKTSTWSLPTANTIVIDSLQAAIKSFNGKILVLTNDTTVSGLTGTITTTFTKQ